jgi:hypothetical protein
MWNHSHRQGRQPDYLLLSSSGDPYRTSYEKLRDEKLRDEKLRDEKLREPFYYIYASLFHDAKLRDAKPLPF